MVRTFLVAIVLVFAFVGNAQSEETHFPQSVQYGLTSLTDPVTGEKFDCSIFERAGRYIGACITRNPFRLYWLEMHLVNGQWVVDIQTQGAAATAIKRALESNQAWLDDVRNRTGASEVDARASSLAPSVAVAGSTVAAAVPAPAPSPAAFQYNPIVASSPETVIKFSASLGTATGVSDTWAFGSFHMKVPYIGVARNVQVNWGDGTTETFGRSVTDPDVFALYHHWPGAYSPSWDYWGAGPIDQWVVVSIRDLDRPGSHFIFFHYDAQPIPPWEDPGCGGVCG